MNRIRDPYGMTAADWARLRAMTETEVLAAARRDPDALPIAPLQTMPLFAAAAPPQFGVTFRGRGPQIG
jgi:hypothetical protein